MKMLSFVLRGVLSGALLAGAGLRAQPFTTETPLELATTLDVNGDGLADLLIVDRITGAALLGRQQAAGDFLWSEPMSTGLDAISSLSVGRFQAGSAVDGFVVSAATWNRVQLFTASDASPLTLALTGIGPSLAVAVEVNGIDNDPAVDDLAIATQENGQPMPHLLGAFHWDGAQISGFSAPMDGPLRRGNRVRHAPTAPWLLGALRPQAGGSEFLAIRCGSMGPLSIHSVTGLPAACDYVWGPFGAAGLSSFIFYVPGQSALDVVSSQDLGGDAFGFGPRQTFDLGLPVGSVSVVPHAGGAWLFVVFADGAAASLFEFDGVTAPQLRQTFFAPTGSRFSFALPLGGGDFALLDGAGGSRRCTRWKQTGPMHVVGSTGAIPAGTPARQARGNVFVYEADPAVSPDAALKSVLRAAEWSDQPAISGGTLTVQAAEFVDSANGLGPLSTRVFGGGFLASDHVNTNQVSAAVCVTAFLPAATAPAERVQFVPAAGTYPIVPPSELIVELVASAPGTIHYRRHGEDVWTIYDPDHPLKLSASATVDAYLVTDGPSPLTRATYTIITPPPLAVPSSDDVDLDGLPDAWETAFGLADPEGDADGDGLSNRDEFIGGTDPWDSSAAPPASDLAGVRLDVLAATGAGGAIDLLWPAHVLGAQLEVSTDLRTWTRVTGPFTSYGGFRYHHYAPATGERAVYFRLHRVP